MVAPIPSTTPFATMKQVKIKKGCAKRSSSLERTETEQKNQQNIEKDSVSQQELD